MSVPLIMWAVSGIVSMSEGTAGRRTGTGKDKAGRKDFNGVRRRADICKRRTQFCVNDRNNRDRTGTLLYAKKALKKKINLKFGKKAATDHIGSAFFW